MLWRLLCVCLLLALPAQALAHAQLRSADPAAGAVVGTAPAVVLTFNEPVAPLQARWFLPDGTAMEVEARAEGEALTVIRPAELPSGLPQGTHAVSWRVVSADGHPVGGTHVFSIGFETGAPAMAAAPAAWPAAAARALLTLALAFGVGGAVWAALSAAPTAPPIRAIAGLTLPAAALLLAAQTMDLAGTGAEALGRLDAWRAALVSPYGLAAILAALSGALALARSRAAALCAWPVAALSFAVAGHAARATPVALMGPLVFLHGLALIFWAGALPALVGALRAADGPARLARFSRLAVPMVALLVVTGAVLAVRQVETPAALIGTAYGAVLTAKLGLVGALLALAAWHRLRLTPALARDPHGTRPIFARSIRLEILLMALVLALTAAFRLTPPPRALADAPESRVALHLHGPTAMADIALLPGRPGANRIEIGPLDGDFQPFAPLAITLFFSRPEDGLEAIAVPATPGEDGEDGLWHAGPVHLPLAGDWDVVIDILITDFQKALIGGDLVLPP